MSESAVVPLPRRARFVLPSWRDPRLHVASALLTVQVLGQTVLDFELSIAQLLASLLTCAVIEVAITFATQRVIAWPASALLTGNGVALILRVEGTEHGDWWSTRGLWIFCVVAGGSLLTKYLVRVDSRPLFNPSNIGLVVAFLVLGSERVNPLDFWLGPLEPGLVAAYVVIIAVGVMVTTRLRLLGVVVAFWSTFAASLALVAAAGHAMTARWHLGPISGADFWWKLVTAPEILIFAFFMITDPRTAPLGQRPRLVFGGAVGFLAAALVAAQRTEFASKVAVLAALVVVCAARPLLERSMREPSAAELPTRRTAGAPLTLAAIAALTLLAAGIPARPAPAAETGPVDLSEVDVDVPVVPVVELDPSVDGVTGGISEAEGQRIAADLAYCLAVEAEAIRRRSIELVAQVTTGQRRAAIETAIADGSAEPQTYELDTLSVRVIHRPIPQSPPRIAVLVVGRRNGEPVTTLFTVADLGDRYMIADELEP